MDELLNRLNNVSDTYAGFVMGVITYAKKKPERLSKVLQFMEDNPEAKSSDIVEFIVEQPDFHEDSCALKENAG